MGALVRQAETGHVGLNVSDLERSKAFYQEVFGFEVVAQGAEPGQRWAFLTRAGEVVVTLWEQSAGRFAHDRPGLHHLSFQVDSVEEVRAAEGRLRELGVNFLYNGVVPHAEGTASGGIFFTDPDGIRLEIFAASGLAGYDAPSGAAPSCGFFESGSGSSSQAR